MAQFHDVIGTLDSFEGLSVPDDFATSISGAYDADMSTLTSGADAKIAQVTQERDAALLALNDLKAQNYDLLMAVGSPAPAADPNTTDDEDEGPSSTDDLFGDDTDKE